MSQLCLRRFSKMQKTIDSLKKKLRLLQTVQFMFLMGVLISRGLTTKLIFLIGGVAFIAFAYFLSQEYRDHFNSKRNHKIIVIVITLAALSYLYLTREHPVL
jgi:Mg2+/citrate symporter